MLRNRLFRLKIYYDTTSKPLMRYTRKREKRERERERERSNDGETRWSCFLLRNVFQIKYWDRHRISKKYFPKISPMRVFLLLLFYMIGRLFFGCSDLHHHPLEIHESDSRKGFEWTLGVYLPGNPSHYLGFCHHRKGDFGRCHSSPWHWKCKCMMWGSRLIFHIHDSGI
jgi:hypothetical protein